MSMARETPKPAGVSPNRRLARRLSTRIALALLIVALGAFVTSVGHARAQTGTSSQAAQAGSPVGSWLVTLADSPTANGAPEIEVASFTSDGIVISTNPPTTPVMPGQGPPGVTQTYSTTALGAWSQSGANQFAFSFDYVDYDSAGNVVDINKISASGSVSADGNSLTGQAGIEVDDPTGNVIFASPGPIVHFQAVRIAAQPAPATP